MHTERAEAEPAAVEAPVRPVPVFVRANGDGWDLVESSTDTAIETFPTARAALDGALGIDEIGAALKTPVIRDDGEPDGEWRWLDASAEETEPIGGVRIDADALWTMAAGLNDAPKPVAVDGGAVDGILPSTVHGTASDSGTLANGWAHVGVPVIDAEDQTHLFLRAELLPEVAAEVDRGRLAFNSIHFRHDGVTDDLAPIDPELASNALTNDPAVQNLTPGSARSGECVRTRRMQMATETTRGAAKDLAGKVAALLGVTLDDALEEGDVYYSPLFDKIRILVQAAQVEDLTEGAGEPAAPAVEGGEAAASAGGESSTREHGLEGADLDAWATAMLDVARLILSKPEATAPEALELLTASSELLAAALAEVGSESDEEAAEAAAEVEAARTAADVVLRTANDTLTSDNATLRTQILERDTKDWFAAEIAKRQLSMPDDRRETLMRIAIETPRGREIVTEALNATHAPPMGEGSVLRTPGSGTRAAGAGGFETKREAVAHFKTVVLREHHEAGTKVPSGHFIHAAAQRRAEKAHPGLFATDDNPGGFSALTGA